MALQNVKYIPKIAETRTTTRPSFPSSVCDEICKLIREVASASGLVLLTEKERNPLFTSTFGTGKMMADAISKGFKNIFLFLGGSATNDAGMGIAAALGFQFFDNQHHLIQPTGGNLSTIQTIQENPKFDLKKINITLLCDVMNPLFGKNGAAYIYAPQKGASSEQVEILPLWPVPDSRIPVLALLRRF